MEIVISGIKSNQDIKLFSELALRLGLTTTKLTLADKEDIGLAIAINEGQKTGFTSESKVLDTLQKIHKSK